MSYMIQVPTIEGKWVPFGGKHLTYEQLSDALVIAMGSDETLRVVEWPSGVVFATFIRTKAQAEQDEQG